MKEDILDGSAISRKDNFKLKHLASDTYFDLFHYLAKYLKDDKNLAKVL